MARLKRREEQARRRLESYRSRRLEAKTPSQRVAAAALYVQSALNTVDSETANAMASQLVREMTETADRLLRERAKRPLTNG